MEIISLKLDQGVPQYACTACGSCNSLFGKSLCSTQSRGCCWYYPKFTLFEIYKMVKSDEGMGILNNIVNLPGRIIYNNYIHAKGYFDTGGYRSFLESGQAYNYDVMDKTIFFRICPFVKLGEGCSLPVKYRSYICNFFICNEINEDLERYDTFKNYIKERESYVRWINWENNCLEMTLREEGLTLANNFDGVLNTLKGIPLENYEFPSLPPIDLDDGFDIGA